MLMQGKPPWELIIEESLFELGTFLAEGNWYGRENEVINLFAHRFLMRRSGAGPLVDSSQIGIEVAVGQIPKAGGKRLVRKDLVLWNEPLETAWGTGLILNSPAVILEWKTDNIAKCNADIEWLQAYTKMNPRVLGYSICAFIKNKKGIWFRKIVKGKAGMLRLAIS
jgi:hypothetical protein